MPDAPVPFTPIPNLQPGEGETTEQFDLMVQGKPYIATDRYLDRLRNHVAKLQDVANKVVGMEERMPLYREYITFRKGERGGAYIVQPFVCEYVSRIEDAEGEGRRGGSEGAGMDGGLTYREPTSRSATTSTSARAAPSWTCARVSLPLLFPSLSLLPPPSSNH
jgi:hypothetical protein